MRKLLLAALTLTLFANASFGQDLIYYWNFNANVPATDATWAQPIAATTGSAQLSFTFANAVSFGGTDINGVTGETYGGSFCPQGGAETANNGKDFTLTIPTTGFTNIKITYPTRKTSSGFTHQEVKYTLNGTDWVTKETVDISAYLNEWNSAQLVTIDFSAITEASDNANFQVKFVLTGATTDVGNNRFDNIKVLGDVAGAVATPVILPETCTFIAAFDATITCTTDGAAIYYTTNGSDPDETSTAYTGAINITETTTLKARAYKSGLNPSNIATATYTLLVPQTTTVPYSETFDTDLGQCYVYSVSGDTRFWQFYGSSQAASMNGYNTGVLEEDWLILPGVTLSSDNVTLSFDSWKKYGTDDANNYIKLYYSTNYEGVGDPTSATWTELTATFATTAEVWTSTGDISLSAITGDPVYIGIKYNYNAGMYAQWQIDNVEINGTVGVNTNTNSTIKAFPNPFSTSLKFENLVNVNQITISNLIGQQIMKVAVSGLSSTEIDTHSLPSGIYLVSILNSTGEKTIKKMVKR